MARELAEKLSEIAFGGLGEKLFIPSCENDGSYSKTQCLRSTGPCWCVTENGEKISGTQVEGKLNCEKGW